MPPVQYIQRSPGVPLTAAACARSVPAVNKTELVAAVAHRTGLQRQDVAEVVDVLLEVVRRSVAKGERVSLSGFGTFERRKRRSRVGRNPHTREAVPIPARNQPSFRPGAAFREAVAVPRKRATGRRASRSRTSRSRR
jgi:DNA-binding protein HU-beta